MPTAEQWGGLCLRTESDRPKYWPFIAWVIRYRLENRFFPNSVEAVVLQPLQFSGFNGLIGRPEEKYLEVWKRFRAHEDKTLIEAAEGCFRWVLATPREQAPFGPDVLWFWSPRSMKPPGRTPAWADKKRHVHPPGVDPWWFIFAAGGD